MRQNSKYFFIDTCVYRQFSFRYESTLFARIQALANDSDLRLLTVNITDKEILSGIEECTEQARGAAKTFANASRILQRREFSEFCATFNGIDVDAIVPQIFRQYKLFTQSLNAIHIEATDFADFKEIFWKYFDRSPPFTNKDKAAFPDAAVISALERWSIVHDVSICVVSTDKGIKDACESTERLKAFDSLNLFIDHILRQSNVITDVAQAVQTWMLVNQAAVNSAIFEQFDSLGFMLDEWGDIDDIQGKAVRLYDYAIVDLQGTEVILSCNAEIDFKAMVTYPDPDGYYRDSDSRELISMGTLNDSLERTTEAAIEFTLYFDLTNSEKTNIECVNINDNNDIMVHLYEQDN